MVLSSWTGYSWLLKWLWSWPVGPRLQQREHCTPTAAPVSAPAPLFSHLKFKTKRPILPSSSNQWQAHCCLLRRGWQMGNRDSSVCVCVGECVEGWVGGWRLVRLIFSHTDMLSHTSDELKRVCIDMQKSGCFRGRVIHSCIKGGILKTQISLPSTLAHHSPPSNGTPSPFI